MAPSIQFLGAAGTVTGSKFLFRTETQKILVDCGLFQGVKELRLQNWEKLPIEASAIDAVILTHAHLDHTGYLPLLVRNGFKGKIYCTAPTRELSKIILNDSAHIQEEDAEYANRLGFSKHSPAMPLYTTSDVAHTLKLFISVAGDKWVKIAKDVKFRLSPSGHILGSAFVELNHSGMRVVFSGDLGRKKPLMLNPPTRLTTADYLVIESTYGDRVHSPESPMNVLKRVINETVARKGHLIIPSFAVGRVQDVLYLISKLKRQKLIPNIPVYLDSPMGIHATEVLLDYPEWHKLGAKEIEAFCQDAIMVRSYQDSNGLARARKSTIVVAGSGMLTGGRVLHHLETRLSDSRNTILLVGFQAAGTRGRLLRDGIPELKMYGKYVPVKARIEELSSLSAHADQSEIIEWLRGFRSAPKTTFIVHGEPQAADALRVRIRDSLNWFAEVPAHLEVKELNLKTQDE
ncbi:MAG: MBL fold metallo-hydrolase [Deltaproteobacteria bacterium]|nr:MBL fold metallo-hydrolase [Deltaproteobacteria bacterium]